MSDLLEYLYGNESTVYGRQRVEDGHEEPYKVKYFELGNEEYNAQFVEQVVALEAKAKALGVGEGQLYYLFPQNQGVKDNDAAKAKALGLRDHLVADEHTGSGG